VNNQFQGDLTSFRLSEAADGASQEGGVSYADDPRWGWLPAGTCEPRRYLLRQPHANADGRTFFIVLLSRS